ncbi:MAG: ATP-binding protein [Pseudomonadota bacterium]
MTFIQKEKVLVIDEDPIHLNLMQTYLKSMKLDMITSDDAVLGLKLFKDNSPLIVILDVSLKNNPGYEVCKKMRAAEKERGSYTPIIVVTSLFEKEDFVKIFESGADDYILKPYRRYELEARIKSAIKLKQYHKQIIEKNDTLKRLIKVKDEFLSMITHDVKNYITAITIASSTLADEKVSESKEDYMMLASMIARKSKLVGDVISDLLTSAKQELGKINLNLKKVDIKELLKEMYDNLVHANPGLNRNVLLEVEDNLPEIELDIAKIDEVVTNLFINATKFTHEGGRILIQAKNFNDHKIVVNIEDNGIGIPTAKLDSIFDKFEQISKYDGKGSGLGLAICKNIIEAHGGDIWAESVPGNWSKFSFTLFKKQNK